jgi:hypothetical protein
VANPFFGNPAFVRTQLGTSPTVPRNQLLRPYPQFLNVLDRQVSEGVSRYNALVVEWTRRSTRGLAGRISYTYSVLKDNQIGEVNFYTANGIGGPLNNYNYMASMPACTTTNFAACFNPMADFTNSIIDLPHRVVAAPIWHIPLATGSSAVRRFFTGWTAAALITLQSGFPIGVTQQSDNSRLGSGQRPNVVPGVDRATPGSLAERLASDDHQTAAWLNPLAFTAAAPETWGNAPRVITDVRSPRTMNTDVSLAKSLALGGGKTAQIRIEVFNLFNRVATLGFASVSFGQPTFGRITAQQNFMRMTQLMFRLSW